MEKIKASDVLAIIKKNYKFLCVDTSGDVSISTHLPEPWIEEDGITWLSSDEHDSIFSTPTIDTRAEISKEESLSSLREIDFSEDFTEERLGLINRITSYLAKELSLRDYNRIKGFFEEMQKPDYVKGFVKSGRIGVSGVVSFSDVLKMKFPVDVKSLKEFKYILFYEDGTRSLTTSNSSFTNRGVSKILEIDQKEDSGMKIVPVGKIVAAEAMSQGTAVYIRESDGKLTPTFPPVKDETQEPSSIFKLDDTVHVLSYSNVGEFGKSTEGIIKTIYKDGTILIKVDESIEEVHNEDNVSFTPFSIKEAGFSQVRPVQEPKEGDYGFFYNKVPCERFSYAKLESITDNSTFRFMNENIGYFAYFSIEPPQLAEGIPNPFAQC